MAANGGMKLIYQLAQAIAGTYGRSDGSRESSNERRKPS
ncbi:predicted protein [Botrytis cinerea T4]|uniref:Uncharacterized protein n=1 Tax=Botryotinia fuckeliana (strain T4) TaxID=999810 RepID=G2YQ52_BOTF4|nr:predicted protein [Botrytis cinerea T4]